jgi:hypothetical protein
MHDPNQPLPADPRQVNPQYFIHGLPQNVPFQINLTVQPAMQPMLGIIVGMTIKELQDNAPRNPIRTFYYNLMCVNGFLNQGFNELVVGVVDYAAHLMNRERMAAAAAIAKAASEVVSLMASVSIRSYPALINYIDPTVRAGAEEWIARGPSMMQAMQQPQGPVDAWGNPIRAPMQQPQVDAWGRPIGGQMGYPQQNNQRMNPGMMGISNNGANMFSNANSQQTYQQNNPNDDPEASFGLQRRRRIFNRQGPPEGMVDEIILTPESPEVNYTRAPMNHPEQAVDLPPLAGTYDELPVMDRGATDTMILDAAGSVIEDQVFYQYKDRMFDYVRFEGTNVEIIPAHLIETVLDRMMPTAEASGISDSDRKRDLAAAIRSWQPTRTEDQPYRLAYNPEEQLLVYMKFPTGVVKEDILKWESTMDYMRNEIKPKLRSLIPADPDAPKVVANFDLLIGVSKVGPTLMSADTVPPPEEVDVPYVVPEVLADVTITTSLDDVRQLAALDSNTLLDANPDYNPQCVECYSDIVHPFYTKSNYIEEVAGLSREPSIKRAIAKLKELGMTMDQKLWTALHDRFTAKVNHVLAYNLQTKYKIDSIIEDYDDLTAVLTKNFGKGIIEVIDNHAAEVITASFSVLSGERLEEYLAAYRPTGDTEHALVLADRSSVTDVPWRVSDLGLEFDQCGAISAGYLPSVHRGVSSVFARCDKMEGQFMHHYLTTLDGVILEIHRGWLGRDYFLISKS